MEEELMMDEIDAVDYAAKILRKSRNLDLQAETFVQALQAMEEDRNLTVIQALQIAEQNLE